MINQKRIIETFCHLVKIDSPSGYEKEMAKFTASQLKDLGLKVVIDEFGNVIGRLEGEGEPLMLNAHLDTVEPGRGIKARITGDKIITDGKTILGADAKAGVAVILETIKSIRENKQPHVPLEIVFTLGEEIGLKGAMNLDYSKITAKYGITFDGKNGVNNITTSAPGYTRVDVKIIGKSYHASMPEKGISAIKIASGIIHQLEIGKIDDQTTANIGLISGGSARNTVPEEVDFKAEIRSLELNKLEKHSLHFHKVINAVIKKHPKANINFDIHTEFLPYKFDESHIMIKKVKRILQSLELKPVLEPSLGGTDVNIFHKHGIEAICVGTGSYEAHTTREYLVIPELIQTAVFCEKLVTSF